MALTRRAWTVIWIGLLVLVVVAYGVGAFGLPFRTDVPIRIAWLVEPDVIEIGLDCGEDRVAAVDESEQQVTVDVRMKVRPGDCGTAEMVELDEPLGDRVLIDGYHGAVVEVARG